jgi:DNA polymerase-3 subunit gamma/tau
MSEQYIVSARKYRPQTFDTVVGQEHITTTLKNAIRNQHLAHAYLFCGPRGVGKTTAARILAKTINCETPTAATEACGECATCRSFGDNTSFNIFELDAASNNSVDDIRELVNQVRFAPQQGKYKIYIIDEVHMLSAAAFNAFLKTLEEPPPYAIFILATTEKHKILPTILSRCQIFDFKRITTLDIVSHLKDIAAKENINAQDAALHVIAQKSEGCMRDALSMFDRIAGFTDGTLTYNATMEHLNMLDADFYFSLTDHLLSQDISGALLLLDEVLDKGFEGNVIIEGAAEHMRNLLLCKDSRMAKLLDVPDDHKPVYFEKANQAPPSFILSSLNLLNECELNYKNSTNKRLHVEMCIIRLCYLLQATANTSSSGQDLKKKPDIGFLPPVNPVSAAIPVPEKKIEQLPVKNMPVEQKIVTPAVVLNEPAAPTYSQPVKMPVEPGNTTRRINKNLLVDIDKMIDEENGTVKEEKQVTEEAIQKLYEEFKNKLRQENKSAYYAQFSRMKVQIIDNQEIRFIAPDEITEVYVTQQRNILSEYFQEHTGVVLRITTEIRKEQGSGEAQEKKVMSKQDIYNAMSEKNPNLTALRSALNLQIEF